MRYFVHGVDREDVDEQLEELGESHWTYIDGHADALVARGPTLSTDGTSHTAASMSWKLPRSMTRGASPSRSRTGSRTSTPQ